MGRGRRAGRVRPAGPQRKCVGCRQVRPQAELLRLVADGGQAVPGKGRPGRGCWLCKEEACVRLALKSGQIPRALKGGVKAPAESRLQEWIRGAPSLDGEGGHGLKS